MLDLDWIVAVPMGLIFIVFLNRYFFGLFLRRAYDSQEHFSDWQPTVAVIIPMYNEGESILHTLRSLSAQDYTRDRLQIVVVDDCSKDDSAAWAEKAAAEDPRIKVVRNQFNIGKRLGIMREVRAADAEIIVSVDSDVIVSPDAVRKLIRRFTSNNIAAVGGKVMVANATQNWLTKMQTVKYFFGYHYLKNIERTFASVMCLSGCLTAYRRHVLLELEPILANRNLLGVPIKYGEDRFLTRQIVKKGYQTTMDLEATCLTKAPATLSGYFSQQLRWRRSNLVDFFGGLSHAFELHPLVGLHYFSLHALIMIYPAVLWIILVNGEFFKAAMIHLGLLAIYAMIYWQQTLGEDARTKVHPAHFLWMSCIMPVTYMVISVLALFTLDTGSWETRQKAAPKPA